MKSSWQNNYNNKLIVIFNGWSMDECLFAPLKTEGYDLLIISDYRDMQINLIDFKKLVLRYESSILISWSMGVYIANNVLHDIKDLGLEHRSSLCSYS